MAFGVSGGFFVGLCRWKTSLFSLRAAVQCLPLRGRLCSRWPTLHECECRSLPFPPPSSGETGTTSFRKKEKKVPGVSSAMELLCPPRVVQWGAEISQRSGIRVGALGWRVAGASGGSSGSLPRPGPLGRNLWGFVLCGRGGSGEPNTGKKVIVGPSSTTFAFHRSLLR